MREKTPRNTTVIPIRVPNDLLQAIKARATSQGQAVSPWALDKLHVAVYGQLGDATNAHGPSWDAGRRAGWFAANAAFRKALKLTSDELKGMVVISKG